MYRFSAGPRFFSFALHYSKITLTATLLTAHVDFRLPKSCQRVITASPVCAVRVSCVTAVRVSHRLSLLTLPSAAVHGFVLTLGSQEGEKEEKNDMGRVAVKLTLDSMNIVLILLSIFFVLPDFSLCC